MIEKKAIIRNSAGIHCRPSAVIVTEVIAYAGEVRVECEAGRANLRSLLDLVALGLEEGTPIRIQVSGPDEEAFCARLVELFERHFDFPQLSEQERADPVSILLVER